MPPNISPHGVTASTTVQTVERVRFPQGSLEKNKPMNNPESTIDAEFPLADESIPLQVLADTYNRLRSIALKMESAVVLASRLPTHQDCPPENHAIVVAAIEALAPT